MAYIDPLWRWQHRALFERDEELNLSISNSRAADRQQDKEIERLQKRVTELEQHLLALEQYLSEKGILPPMPEASEPDSSSEPVVFSTRTEETITCPVCGRRQKGNRDRCYSCGVKFQYEDE